MKYLFGLLIAVTVFFSIPVPVDAQLVSCGRGPDQTSACTLCDIVKGAADITNYLRNIMVFVALVVIVAMGIMYIVSAGNPGMMETAKKGVYAALIGIVVILAAWIIVNTIMYVVFDVNSGNVTVLKGFSVLSGFTFDCSAAL